MLQFSRSLRAEPTIQDSADPHVRLEGDTYHISLFAAQDLEGGSVNLETLYAYIE